MALHHACPHNGAITNSIMPILRQRELELMLNHARSELVVTPQRFRDFDHGAMIAGKRARYITLESIAPISDDPIVSLPAVAA